MLEHKTHLIPHHCDFWSMYCDAVNRAPYNEPSVFVEVGTWQGCSLHFLAVQARHSQKPIQIFGVDCFEDTISTDMGDQVLPTIEQVQAHFTDLPDVQLIKSLSWDAAKLFEEECVDFCFIDADHTFESVQKDLAAWWPKIKPGGYLAGHDYSLSYPGVVAAVHEKFGPVKRVVSSWIVQKLK